MRGIEKSYGRTLALRGVDMTAGAAEIHAVLGENGAGKTTLMHVLAGITSPERGVISIDGSERRIGSPQDARSLGIAMVHQHFALAPAFTVAENLALDRPAARTATLNYNPDTAAAEALGRARELGWDLDPGARTSTLPVGIQQRVEIAKALATDARILIFDEPTAVLTAEEVSELFAVLRRLRSEGRTVLLIAHKLAEITAIADHVTVLRRGGLVATAPIAGTSVEQLAEWMMGAPPDRVADADRTSLPAAAERHALEATDIRVAGSRGREAVAGCSLRVEGGEIFGIGGVEGNGQAELAEALAGLRPLTAGRIEWDGAPARLGSDPRVGYIPQDRRREGLATSLSVRENLLMEAVREPAYSVGPLLRRNALTRQAADLMAQFDIRAPSPAAPVATLSGGNQQKVVVARALRANPGLIVAVNPTRGLDIAATKFVHAQLLKARAEGAAIVLFSADLDELRALADRAAIISSGSLRKVDLASADFGSVGLLLGGVDGASYVAAERSGPAA